MTTQELAEELNRLYWTDMDGYLRRLNEIKSKGNKVFRNSKGQHKVESEFGDIFNSIFNGTFGR